MSTEENTPHGMANARLVGGTEMSPSVQIGVADSKQHMSVILKPVEARHLSYMLIALAAEAEVQSGYITALRTHKTPEEEIMELVTTAASYIVAERMI